MPDLRGKEEFVFFSDKELSNATQSVLPPGSTAKDVKSWAHK